MVIEVETKRLVLNNNCTLEIGDGQQEYLTPIQIECPRLESDNVYLNSNSDFSKIERVVDYLWPTSLEKINWLTVHRSKPYIAYVMHPDYNEAKRATNRIIDIDPKKQMVRIHNYHNQKRGLVKPCFSAPITDLAFAYISFNIAHENRLAISDQLANIQIHEFVVNEAEDLKTITTLKLLEIISDSQVHYSEVRLAWCPGHIIEKDDAEDDSVEDLGMNLGISFDNNVEIYSAGVIINNGIRHLSKEELEFTSAERRVIRDPDNEKIISLSISNDLTTICAASKDNKVRFYEISETSVKQVHNWEPKMKSNDQLSCIFFLDDFNELLENQDSHFWGHVLVGTTKGDLTIWNLNSWKPIQKLSLNCFNNGIAEFEYRIDVSSHVIVAVHGETAFLLSLDFLELDDGKHKESSFDQASGHDDDKILAPIKEPRISKITRFQLYNPVLSFYVKRPNPSEVEIFWITEKSLEKCIINLDNLIAEENPSVFLSYTDISSITNNYGVKHPIFGGNDLDGKSNDAGRRVSSPPVTLAEIFNSMIPKACEPSTTLAKDPLPSVSHSLINDSLAPRPTTPASREVEDYLGSRIDHEKLVPSYPLSSLIDQRLFEPLVKDLATENTLKAFESKLIAHLNSKLDSIKSDMLRMNGEIVDIKNQSKDSSQLKANTKLIDGLIRKLMAQLNQTFVKGLEEFLLQIKSETAEISNTINQSRVAYTSQLSFFEKQLKQYEIQMQEVRKQTTECSLQQKEILAQLQAQAKEIQAASPALSMRERQLLRLSFNTPPPGDASKSLWALNPDYEEEKRRKAEEEKVAKLKNIWFKIRTENPKLVIEAISSAFELKDQSLIKEVYEYYHKNKGAAHLVNLIANDQAILLSFLSNLASSDLRDENWKIPFITKIVPHLDIKSPIVKDWLPRFDSKLIARLEEAEKIFGETMPDIALILRILYLYRDQCK